ncbi:hypothetical protein BDW75DRAFT_123489 [Aspergillus navahoensis]
MSTYAYYVYVTNSSFVSLAPASITWPNEFTSKYAWNYGDPAEPLKRVHTFEKLMPKDCVLAYATDFQTEYSNVLLISDDFADESLSIEFLFFETGVSEQDGMPYDWICQGMDESQPCSVRIPGINKSNWYVSGYKIDYCLAAREPPKCMLEFSLPLAIVVTANISKTILLFLAVYLSQDSPLLTTGDAVCSFLQRPDARTQDKCLLSHTLVRVGEMRLIEQDTIQYSAHPKRRWSSLSGRRWVLYLLMFSCSVGACIGLLAYGLNKAAFDREMHYTENFKTGSIWDIGLGAFDAETTIQSDISWWPRTLIPCTLIANIPQLIFTVLYLLSNSIITNMALATEWNTFSFTRCGLRVSRIPQGRQRTSYFLSLPYRYGLPLICLSAVLHWLISQSIFLKNIQGFTPLMQRNDILSSMTLGWSPRAILIVICFGGLLPVGLIAMGLRRFTTGMPVAGSCTFLQSLVSTIATSAPFILPTRSSHARVGIYKVVHPKLLLLRLNTLITYLESLGRFTSLHLCQPTMAWSDFRYLTISGSVDHIVESCISATLRNAILSKLSS